MKSSVLVISLLWIAACTSANKVGQKNVSDASFETNNVVNNQKMDFIRITDNHIDDVERKVNEWKTEASNASGSLKEKRYDRITKVEKRLDEARGQLNKLKVAPVTEYKKIKENVDDSIKSLDEEFEDASKEFK